MRYLPILLLPVLGLVAMQQYTGPRPAKPDIPYLLHANALVETEATEAKEQPRKDDILYVIEGANSPARTPLASPVLLLQTVNLDPGRLQLYKLDSRNGQREILFRKKKNNTRPIRIEVSRLTREGLYKIEVDETLVNGEYSLTPEGSNQVFCFQVY